MENKKEWVVYEEKNPGICTDFFDSKEAAEKFALDIWEKMSFSQKETLVSFFVGLMNATESGDHVKNANGDYDYTVLEYGTVYKNQGVYSEDINTQNTWAVIQLHTGGKLEINAFESKEKAEVFASTFWDDLLLMEKQRTESFFVGAFDSKSKNTIRKQDIIEYGTIYK